MSAPYHHLRDRGVAVVDRAFGETVKVVFVKDGKADPERPAIEVTAVLRTAAQVSPSMAGGRGQAWNAEIAAGSATLFVNRSRYPDLSLNKGDRVQAIQRPGLPWFDVARQDSRSHGRLIVHLSEG